MIFLAGLFLVAVSAEKKPPQVRAAEGLFLLLPRLGAFIRTGWSIHEL